MAKRGFKSRRNERAERAPAPAVAGRRSRLVQVAVVFAVALAARAAHFTLMRDSIFFDVLVCDAWQYDQWAQRLAAGDWLGGEVFYQTPLYPYFVGVVYAAFGHSVWAVRIVQALVGSLGCVLAARAGAAFFSQRVGWVAGLLLAVYPPAIFFDGVLQKASLDFVLMAALLWVLGTAQRTPRWWLVAGAGAVLGAMTLNRENAAALVPLLAIWAAWLAGNKPLGARCASAAVLVAGVAAVLLPVGVRNYYVGGQFLVTTSQMGPNFYIGNHQGADGRYAPLRKGRGDPRHESEDARLLAEEAEGRSLSPGEVSDYWMRRAAEDIRRDPAAWLRLLAWKGFLTFNSLELIDADSVRAHARESYLLAALVWVLHFGVLFPLAVGGAWLSRAQWRSLWVLYAMFVVFAAAVALFFVFARYRYPLVPLSALFAGAGLVGAWDLVRGRVRAPRRELAIAAALAAAAAVMSNWPLGRWHDDEVNYFLAGTAYLDDGRPDDAYRALRRAVDLNPDAAASHNNLGRAALALGRLDEAANCFRRALELDPQLAAAQFGLGEVYQKQNDADAAVAAWKRAAEIDPLLAAPQRALGRQQMLSGNPRAAAAHFRRVVELEPRRAPGYVELAAALSAEGEVVEAIGVLRAGMKLERKSLATNNLAWILATCPDASLRHADEALALAEEVCALTNYEVPDLLDTLAAANANAGRFDKAVEWSDKALELARRDDNAALVESLAARRSMYLEKQPYRDPLLRPKPATR